MRRLFLVAMVASLALQLPASGQTPTTATPEDLATGVRQVEKGDLSAAAITLDGVIQRLKQERGRAQELATAHLYLATVYVGLSQWERAKDEMREAWRNDPQLTLNPQKFPPRVLELYNETRREQQQAASHQIKPEAETASAPAGQPTAKPGSRCCGSSSPLLVAGGVAVVGGAVALAASKGSSATPTPEPLWSSYGHCREGFLGSSPPAGSTLSQSQTLTLTFSFQCDVDVPATSLQASLTSSGGAACYGKAFPVSLKSGQAATYQVTLSGADKVVSCGSPVRTSSVWVLGAGHLGDPLIDVNFDVAYVLQW